MSFKVGDVVMCVNDNYPFDSSSLDSSLDVSDTIRGEFKAGEFYVVLAVNQGDVKVLPNGRFWNKMRFVLGDALVESIIKIQNESNSSHS